MKITSYTFLICFILGTKQVVAQFVEEKNYISIEKITGSDDLLIMRDGSYNYYDFNTQFHKPTCNKFYNSGLSRLGNPSYDELKTITLIALDGKTIVQFGKKETIEEIIVINPLTKKSKLVKLSQKVNKVDYWYISDDGLSVYCNKYIINTSTGKVINLSSRKNEYIQSVDITKNTALYDENANGLTVFTIRNLVTNSIIKKWTIANDARYYLASKWLLTVLENNDNNLIEALNIVTGTKVKFPFAISQISTFESLGKGKCFFNIYSSKKGYEQYIWDIDNNKAYKIAINNKTDALSNIICLGSKNTVFSYSTTGGIKLQKIDYTQNKVIQEWQWGDEYSSTKTRLSVSNISYTKEIDDTKLKPLFSNYNNYSAKEHTIKNCVTQLQEVRKTLYKLPFKSKKDISSITVKYVDINSDGFKDAIFYNETLASITVLLNDKQNNFTKAIQLPAIETDYGNVRLNFKDINGDGKPELLFILEKLEQLTNIYIFDFTIVDNAIKYYEVKKEYLVNFASFYTIKEWEQIDAETIERKPDFDKNGELDFVTIVDRFKAVSINTLPPLSEAVLNKLNLKSFPGTLLSDNFSIVFPSFPVFALEGDFDNDGNEDFLVSTNLDGTYIFFNTNNGKDFEVKRINTVFKNAEMFNINNKSIYLGRSYRDLVAFSCDEKRNVVHEKLFKNIVESYFDYDSFEDLDNDGLKEFINFASVFDTKEQIINESNITVYKPLKNKNNIYYDGLVIDLEKEQADKDAEWTKRMREKEEEKRKRETVSTGSSTAKKEEPKAEPIDYSKLSTGVAYYKGYGENGLVIEVEANVWYKNVKTTGMLGFRYYEVYKAECRRFRYPNNANKWLFTSSSDCLYKCYSNSSSLCIPIQGIVFRLGEPKIY